MLAVVLLMATCGSPAPDGWTGSAPTPDDEGSSDRDALEGSLRGATAVTEWEDPDSSLSVQLPDGWLGWPGVPGNPIRLYLEHSVSQASVRVYRDSDVDMASTAEHCEWAFGDTGVYSPLKINNEVQVSSCWPEVPGGQRYEAWSFRANQADWVVIAGIMGGQGAHSAEAIAELLGALRF